MLRATPVVSVFISSWYSGFWGCTNVVEMTWIKPLFFCSAGLEMIWAAGSSYCFSDRREEICWRRAAGFWLAMKDDAPTAARWNSSIIKGLQRLIEVSDVLLLYLCLVVWRCRATAGIRADGARHPGCFSGNRWRRCTAEINASHSAAGQSSGPADKSLFCLSYCPVALQGLLPHPTQSILWRKNNHVFFWFHRCLQCTDAAQICYLPWPSFESVSSFPAHIGTGMLGSWGAGIRFQLHMLMYSGPFLGSCWGDKCAICQNTPNLWTINAYRCDSFPIKG